MFKLRQLKDIELYLAIGVLLVCYPYFIWGNTFIFTLFCFLIQFGALLVTFKRTKRLQLDSNFLFFIAFLFWVIFNQVFDGVIELQPLYFLPLLFLLIENRMKLVVFEYFIKLFALLLLISFVAYLFFCFGFIEPSTEIIKLHDGRRYSYYFLNCIARTELQTPFYITTGFYRFYSFLDEPGYVGTLSVLILCAKKFNFKHYPYLIIYLISGLFTFSLAFYFTGVLFVVFYFNVFKRFFQISILFIVIYFIAGNFIKAKVLDRISESETAITRQTGSYERRFNDFLNSSDLYIGRGLNKHSEGLDSSEGGTANWTVLIYNFGIIGFVLYILFVFITYKNISIIDKFSIVFLLIYLLTLYHRPNLLKIEYLVIFYGGLLAHRQKFNQKFKNERNSILY